MHQNKLFNRTVSNSQPTRGDGANFEPERLTTHQMLVVAHWHAVEQELESGTLHDTLEPKLIQPNRIEPAIRKPYQDCVLELIAQMTPRHILGIVQEGNYYVRFFYAVWTTAGEFGKPTDCRRQKPKRVGVCCKIGMARAITKPHTAAETATGSV